MQISYYSCRVGFACGKPYSSWLSFAFTHDSRSKIVTCRLTDFTDQVVNYQVVLADGRIVEANQETNRDLFHALRGGGNNFGIVTRFDMVTLPAHDVWDGTIVHPGTETSSIINALVTLTDQLDVADNPDAHFLGLWTHSPQMPEVFVTSVLTHLDGVPDPKSMEKFLNIPGQNNLRATSMATKVAEFLVPSNK